MSGFDPGRTARSAGAWTRLRRSLAGQQVAVAGAGQFNPDLNVQLAGPWTRLRRSGSELAADLPAIPRTSAAPVAVALVGAVAATSLIANPPSLRRARDASASAGGASPVPAAAAQATQAGRQEAPALASLDPGEVQATLAGTTATLPEGAPRVLVEAVAAANRIEGMPYSYGGGHGSFESSGYDCSGAVSYALHGAGLLDTPLASGALASWGEPGEGRAITVYANGGHAFAVIAGLRWDTSGTGNSGPSWHADMRSTAGFVARHPAGL